MIGSGPVRILQVHSDLKWGGVEQWLYQVAERAPRREVQLDFFAASWNSPWEALIERKALRLVPSPRPRKPFAYVRALRRTLRQGRYDAVHCHFVDHSGAVLREAKRAGVPCRIAHSHIDLAPMQLSTIARAYIFAQHKMVHRYATRGVAASSAAARSMFGHQWEADCRWSVLPCGVNLDPFLEGTAQRRAVRNELQLTERDIVFAHVGRFMDQKNHGFLVEVAAHLSAALPQARFVLLGEGPLENSIREAVRNAGLTSSFRFAGPRPDAAHVLLAADAFLFPSRYEGLGLALVEAQAAGLRCFVSDTVPEEATVAAPLVMRLSLEQAAATWASRIALQMAQSVSMAQPKALAAVLASPFNIDRSVSKLLEMYHEHA